MPFRRLSAHTERATTVSSKPLGCEALLKKKDASGREAPLIHSFTGRKQQMALI